MTRRLAVLAMCLACSANPVAPSPMIPAASTPAPVPIPSTSAATLARNPYQMSLVLSRVSSLRHLSVRHQVRAEVISRPDMLHHLQQHLGKDVPPEAIEGESTFLKTFGFLPPDFDLQEGILQLLKSQLAGFYEPELQTLFVVGDLDEDEAESTLAHELVHALQDQHFSLRNRLSYQIDGGDRTSSVQCLAEGDATSVTFEYAARNEHLDVLGLTERELRAYVLLGMALSPDLGRFPRILLNSLTAPYIDGTLFVHRLRRAGGWDAVDAAWSRPPETTEQVLHFDKFLAREPAESVPVPSLAGLAGEWTIVHGDIYGEQALRIALEEWLSHPAAAVSAQGWAGDHAMCASGHGTDGVTAHVAAWHVLFDSSKKGSSSEPEEVMDALALAWNEQPVRSFLCHRFENDVRVGVRSAGRGLVLTAWRSLSPDPSDRCPVLSSWSAQLLSPPRGPRSSAP